MQLSTRTDCSLLQIGMDQIFSKGRQPSQLLIGDRNNITNSCVCCFIPYLNKHVPNQCFSLARISTRLKKPYYNYNAKKDLQNFYSHVSLVQDPMRLGEGTIISQMIRFLVLLGLLQHFNCPSDGWKTRGRQGSDLIHERGARICRILRI